MFLTADSRLHDIQVRGDLIVPKSATIQTRSKSKTNPDRFTTISLPLKILKIFVREFRNAPANGTLDSAALQTAADVSDEDDEWEDEATQPENSCKSHLTMDLIIDLENLAGEHDERGLGNETRVFIGQFFEEVKKRNTFDYERLISQLSAEERSTLQGHL